MIAYCRWPIVGLVALLAGVAHADVPWHAGGWTHRAIAGVTQAGSDGVDVAAVRVLHCGLTQDDADDLRVFDAAGKPVPYEVAYHHPGYDALLLMRAMPGDTLTIYFGNDQAPIDPMRAIRPTEIGNGPPTPGPAANGWIPRAGLVLTTMRRPLDTPNPTTVDAMRQLIAASPGLDGADLVDTISHGLNPFGDSDHYISIYRGWLQLPPLPGSDKTWDFCTASNEASFSFIDGKDLVHWPGRHTEQRGKYGEKSAQHALDAGLHYVEYAHEEVLLYQTAFLGWKSPGHGRHDAIPATAWPLPHTADVHAYEHVRVGPTVMPRIELIDSLWPADRTTGQYTRFRFTAIGQADSIRELVWHFGDGVTAQGLSVEHVYLRSGSYDVTIEVQYRTLEPVTLGHRLTVFPVEHLESPFIAADPEAYRAIVAGYPPAALDISDATELAWYYREFGGADDAMLVAEVALGKAPPQHTQRADLLLLASGDVGGADAWWSSMPVSESAVGRLREAHENTSDARTQLRILGRLIRLCPIDRDGLQAAHRLFADAQTLVKTEGLAGRMKEDFRGVVMAMGDVFLLGGDTAAASGQYQLAEAMNEPVVPANVRAAKVGAYPEALEQHFVDKDWEAAQAVVDEWQRQFPADQVGGAPLFYRGKLAMLQNQPGAAVRPLEVAVKAGRGSEFEAEARYLLAQAYRQTDDDAAYRRTLQELVKAGLAGTYRERAMKELGL